MFASLRLRLNLQLKNIKTMRRHKLISEIYKHAEVINANKTTLVFLIATMTDKALTKFHKEFMEKEPYTV